MLLLLPIAFLSGLLTVFSPCVLPILPVVLASGIDGNKKRVNGVVVGLVLSFTLATLLLSTIIQTLGVSVDTIRTIAVVLLALFGVTFLFPNLWNKMQFIIEKYWHVQPVQSKDAGFWGGFITGASLGIVWTPCIGPIVATVATLAAASTFSFSSIMVTFSYALGAGVPLYFIARGGRAVTSKLTFFKTENQKIRQAFGIIIILSALFIYTGGDRALQTWTLDNLPESWTNLASTFEERFNLDSELEQIK